jgi:serine/threonine-protein kinase
MALNPGDTLLSGHYQILRLLGRGGFGFVYLARDALLHEEVAIKELIPALVGDDTMLKRFLAEAKATMRLTHKHIVRTHNVFSEGGNYYIVMEYMPGGSLEERLRNDGSLPADEAVRIATEVCDGLSCAHEEGVVHCDLKPANILLAGDGRAKVADFGIAHVSENVLTRTWRTPAGFVAGTLPYMSPEQADGVRDDPRIDIYALGAVLYRALTGQTYLGFDQRETPGAQADNVLRIRNENPAPPSTHTRHVPGWLDDVVLKALAKDPDERYGSAHELQAALRPKKAEMKAPPAHLEGVEAGLSPRPASLHGRQVSRLPRYFWIAGGGALVLVILLVLVVGMLGDDREGELASTPTDTPVLISTLTDTAMPISKRTNTAMPTITSQPTTEPTTTPTRTLLPTATLAPTLMASPTSTPTATPTHTPTKIPTVTPLPTPGGHIFFEASGGELGCLDVGQSELESIATIPGLNSAASVSPDGSRIAFSLYTDAERSIYLADFDGTDITRLKDFGVGTNIGLPLWFDAENITFSAYLNGYWDIHSINISTKETMLLFESKAARTSPSWSSDRMRLAYMCSPGDGWDICISNPDGSDATRLTFDEGYYWSPSISPDGTKIAFVSGHDGDDEIFLIDANGGNMRKVTNNSVDDTSPTWSPNGRYMAYLSEENGSKIHITNSEGVELQKLPFSHSSTLLSIFWSP